MCMDILLTRKVCHLCESVRPPGTGVLDGCEWPCWHPNLVPMQEQQLLITAELLCNPNSIILYNL